MTWVDESVVGERAGTSLRLVPGRDESGPYALRRGLVRACERDQSTQIEQYTGYI